MAMVKQQVFIPQNLKMSPQKNAFRSLSKNISGVLPKIQPFPSWNVASYHVEFSLLGGGFKYVLFSPLFGEDEPIFQMGWFNHQLVSNHPNQNDFHPFSVVVSFWNFERRTCRHPQHPNHPLKGRLRNKSRMFGFVLCVFKSFGVDVSKTHECFV